MKFSRFPVIAMMAALAFGASLAHVDEHAPVLSRSWQKFIRPIHFDIRESLQCAGVHLDTQEPQAVLYYAFDKGTVGALKADSGRSMWTHTLPFEILGRPMVVGNLVLVCGYDAHMVALDKFSGLEKWRVMLDAEAVGRVQADNEHIYLQTLNNSLYAIDYATGKTVWVYQKKAPDLSMRTQNGPTLQGEHLYVAMAQNTLSCLTARTGRLVWESPLDKASGHSEIERLVDVVSPPILLEESVVAGIYDRGLKFYDHKLGHVQAYKEERLRCAPVVCAKRIFYGVQQQIVSLNHQGQEVERFEIEALTPIDKILSIHVCEGEQRGLWVWVEHGAQGLKSIPVLKEVLSQHDTTSLYWVALDENGKILSEHPKRFALPKGASALMLDEQEIFVYTPHGRLIHYTAR